MTARRRGTDGRANKRKAESGIKKVKQQTLKQDAQSKRATAAMRARKAEFAHHPSPNIRGGDPNLPAKRAEDSQLRLSLVMNPILANPLGNVHGGEIMKLVDETGGFCAMKHARNVTVTVAMDSMTFLSPVHVGSLLTLHASVNWVGRTSMEVGVRVEAENVVTGQVTHTNSAYLVYVALDQFGQPSPVPPLRIETEAENRRWEAGAARQAHRLKQANKKAEVA